MASQFLGQIQLVAFNFAPSGWAMCDGQLLPITQNTALFSLLGTYYGGDGIHNFALPNLQGMGALGMGQGPGLSPYYVGETGGAATVTLSEATVPPHTHAFPCSTLPGHATAPSSALYLGTVARGEAKVYNTTATSNVAMSPGLLATVGGSAPHNNLMPYVVMNYVIALTGIYPARQ